MKEIRLLIGGLLAIAGTAICFEKVLDNPHQSPNWWAGAMIICYLGAVVCFLALSGNNQGEKTETT
jgi:hypothetical protein